jgi:glucose-6-phosphate isomerase
VTRQRPFSTDIDLTTGKMSVYERHTTRHASDMSGYFHIDLDDDPLIYEYYERDVPAEAGQIVQNITIVYPGTVDGEYYMTKGHYHANMKCSEVYLCLSGEGCLVMQTSRGEWDVKEYQPGRTVYVPPGWAHRSVNTGDKSLVLYAVFPAHSGHDYDKISKRGFLVKVMRNESGQPSLLVPGEGNRGVQL